MPYLKSEAFLILNVNEVVFRGLNLDYILNTHHHWDHTGGNVELKQKYSCMVVGPLADKDRIPGIDVALKDGDQWDFGELKMSVFDTPGHTKGHITLYFPEASSVFPGTLFEPSVQTENRRYVVSNGMWKTFRRNGRSNVSFSF